MAVIETGVTAVGNMSRSSGPGKFRVSSVIKENGICLQKYAMRLNYQLGESTSTLGLNTGSCFLARAGHLCGMYNSSSSNLPDVMGTLKHPDQTKVLCLVSGKGTKQKELSH